jgi:hypothetical protein
VPSVARSSYRAGSAACPRPCRRRERGTSRGPRHPGSRLLQHQIGTLGTSRLPGGPSCGRTNTRYPCDEHPERSEAKPEYGSPERAPTLPLSNDGAAYCAGHSKD